MFYQTIKDYLIDQVREPIKEALEKGNKEEVMEILDYELMKHIECNAFSKAMEDYAAENGVKVDMPIMEYVHKYVSKYMYNTDFENLKTYYEK